MSLISSGETTKLIEEVEKRPALYKKSLKEYADANLKKSLWEEVCEAVVPNWLELTSEERRKQGHEVQKKWLNLRTCFKRELNAQKNVKSGQAAKTRREYVYFQNLLFLLPSVQSRPTESNIDLTTTTDADDDTEDNVIVRRTSTPRKRKINKTTSNSEVDEALLNALKNTEVDEDYNFAMSIVPSLRELSADEKLEAKIQILSIFKEIRNMRQQNFNLQQSTLFHIVPPNMQTNLDPVQSPQPGHSRDTSQSQAYLNPVQSPQPGHSRDTSQSQAYLNPVQSPQPGHSRDTSQSQAYLNPVQSPQPGHSRDTSQSQAYLNPVQSPQPGHSRDTSQSQDYLNPVQSPQPGHSRDGHSSDTAQSYLSSFTPSPLFDL